MVKCPKSFYSTLRMIYIKKSSMFNIVRELSSWCNGLSVGLWHLGERVRIPVALLSSLSHNYPSEVYEPLDLPSYGLNSTTTVLEG